MSDYSGGKFSEYVDETATVPISEIEAFTPSTPQELVVEEKMYGINKPKRSVIRARITHDKD